MWERHEKSQVKCYNCQKLGLYASDCKAPTNRVEEKGNYVERKDESRSRYGNGI